MSDINYEGFFLAAETLTLLICLHKHYSVCSCNETLTMEVKPLHTKTRRLYISAHISVAWRISSNSISQLSCNYLEVISPAKCKFCIEDRNDWKSRAA